MDAANQQSRIDALEMEVLMLQIEVTKANIAGFQQSIMMGMDKIPQLEARLKVLMTELERRQPSTTPKE